MLRNLFSIFGIILIAGGIYIVTSVGPAGPFENWTTTRALQLAYNGWDLVLFIIGACMISSAVIFHIRVKEEEFPS